MLYKFKMMHQYVGIAIIFEVVVIIAHLGQHEVIGATCDVLRSFLSPFGIFSWNIFFKNVIKSIKNSLKCMQLNRL